MKSIIVILCCIILVSCDPPSHFTQCDYSYPINAIGLHDTIKTTDTIWIENDLDATLCLNEGIYLNGKGHDSPFFFKLVNDSVESYEPKIFGTTEYNYNGERYKSKYGFLFSEPGIYSISKFGCSLANGKDERVFIQGYFNVSSNNMNLFPANVKMPDWEIGQPNKYFVYFFEVID